MLLNGYRSSLGSDLNGHIIGKNVNEHFPKSDQTGTLYRQIRAVLEDARSRAYRAINFTMVQAYWQIGRLLVESEQKGKIRAAYGKAVLQGVADRLTAEFGKGYTVRNLRYMRQFFLTFSKRNAMCSESSSVENLNGSYEKFRFIRLERTCS